MSIAICNACQSELAAAKSVCRCCALALDAQTPRLPMCGQCTSNPPPFEQCVPLGDYVFPLREMIARFKFQGHFSIGRALGQLLAARLTPIFETSPPDILLPVPLHSGRLRERGYNQSIEIARQLSGHLKTPTVTRYCQRVRASRPQRGLSSKEREINVQGRFQIFPEAIHNRPNHILIIDDVVTTMATVKAIANLLKKEGVERVDVACLARVS